MTRGKWVLIKANNEVYVTCEFNGDMYYEHGYGKEVVEHLRNVTDEVTFEKEVRKFDIDNFGYANDYDDYFGINKCMLSELDFKKSTYFDKWFSDYLYIKNIDTRSWKIIDYNGKEHYINPNETFVMNFGKVEEVFSDDGMAHFTEKNEPEDNTPEEKEPLLPIEFTISKFTFDSDEIRKLYDNGLFDPLSPNNSLYDALHVLISKL